MVGNNITTGQVACTGTAAKIVATNLRRMDLLVTNTGTVTVYVGRSGVTTATGFPVPAGASLTVSNNDELYGVTAGTSATVAYLENGG